MWTFSLFMQHTRSSQCQYLYFEERREIKSINSDHYVWNTGMRVHTLCLDQLIIKIINEMGICLKAWISPLHASKSITRVSCEHESAIMVVAIFIKRKHVHFDFFFTISNLQNIRHQNFLCLTHKMNGGIMGIDIQFLRMRCSEAKFWKSVFFLGHTFLFLCLKNQIERKKYICFHLCPIQIFDFLC